MEQSDAVLLERWQRARDAEAFSALVERYSGLVYSSCRRMLWNSGEAEDVAQECFIALMQTRDHVRLSLGAWLHTIAVRRCIDHIRRSSRRHDRDMNYATIQGDETLPSAMELAEVLAKVDEAIEALPRPLREAVVARFLEGRQHTEIARALGVAESTMRHRVGQGVDRIRERLQRQGITVAGAALATALECSAEAAPTALVTGINKLFVSGVIGGGTAIAAAWTLAIKVTAMLVIVLAGIGVWKGIGFIRSTSPETSENTPVTDLRDNAVASHETPRADSGVVTGRTPPDSSAAVLSPEENQAPFSVRGRVYDAETGAGVAGVMVQVFPEGGGKPIFGDEPTDANGVYRIGQIEDGTYSVTLGDVPGYPEPVNGRRLSVTIAEGKPVSGADIALKRGIAMRGTVVTAAGKPASAVSVGAVISSTPNPITSESDEKGNFIVYLPGPDEQVMLQARSEGHESALLRDLSVPDTGLDGLALTLDRPRTGSIGGMVVDGDGAPVAGLNVQPFRKDSAVFRYGPAAETDRGGRFLLEGFAAGEYALIVTPSTAQGFSTAEEYARVTLETGEQANDVRIVFGELDGFAIAGKVTDDQGKPVMGASVSSFGDPMIRVYTENDGSFIMTGLKEGMVSLEVEHMDYSRTDASITAGSFDAHLVLHKRALLHGRVVDADSRQPLTRFMVGCVGGAARELDEMLYGSGGAVESADGTFERQNLNAGEFTVIAWAEGHAPASNILTVQPEETLEVELALEPIAPVEGVVMDEHAVPVAGAVVYFTANTALDRVERAAAARSDSQGRFTLTSPPKGLSWLAAHKPGYGVGITRSPGAWQIVLPEQAVIEGVVSGDDVPPKDVNICVNYADDNLPYLQTRADAEGRFRITGLSPGDLTLSAFPNTGPRRTIKWTMRLESGQTKQVEFLFAFGTGVVEGMISADDSAPEPTVLYLERQYDDCSEVLQTRSGADGRYRFDYVTPGDWILQVIHPDQTSSTSTPDTIEFPITLNDNEVLQHDISLTP